MARPFALSPTDLFARLFSDHPPVILDIRVPDHLAEDEGWIPGSHRFAFGDLDGHLSVTEPGDEAVVICQGGLKLGQGGSARLTQQGRQASFLAGGHLAWRELGLPLMDAAPGLWVSGGDDLAARWLAARLLPRPHEILEVSPDQVELAADRFGGQPLPDAAALLALFDRPVPVLQSAVDFAGSAAFAQLARGFTDETQSFATLDAWMLGAEAAA